MAASRLLGPHISVRRRACSKAAFSRVSNVVSDDGFCNGVEVRGAVAGVVAVADVTVV